MLHGIQQKTHPSVLYRNSLQFTLVSSNLQLQHYSTGPLAKHLNNKVRLRFSLDNKKAWSLRVECHTKTDITRKKLSLRRFGATQETQPQTDFPFLTSGPVLYDHTFLLIACKLLFCSTQPCHP